MSAPCTSGTSYDAGGYPGWGDSNKCSDCQQPLALVALGQFLARPANMRRSRLEVEQGSNRKGGVRGTHCARFPPRCNLERPPLFFRGSFSSQRFREFHSITILGQCRLRTRLRSGSTRRTGWVFSCTKSHRRPGEAPVHGFLTYDALSSTRPEYSSVPEGFLTVSAGVLHGHRDTASHSRFTEPVLETEPLGSPRHACGRR